MESVRQGPYPGVIVPSCFGGVALAKVTTTLTSLLA